MFADIVEQNVTWFWPGSGLLTDLPSRRLTARRRARRDRLVAINLPANFVIDVASAWGDLFVGCRCSEVQS